MFRYTSTQKQLVSNEMNIIYFQFIAYLFRDFSKFNFELQFDVTKNFQNNISTTAAANKQKKNGRSHLPILTFSQQQPGETEIL